jgi:predicted DNA-binding ribbon-helix-helix protein
VNSCMIIKSNKLTNEDFSAIFKAIKTDTGRHGIKMEKMYWDVIEDIATNTNSTVSSVVADAEVDYPEQSNLTSKLRLICLSTIKYNFARMQLIANEGQTKNLISACPTPVLALTADKRLFFFNEPFLRYIHSHFSIPKSDNLTSKLRLLLDVQIDVLIEKLVENGNQRVQVGIAIGLDDRRIRSQMNVLLAPLLKQNVIIGYLYS